MSALAVPDRAEIPRLLGQGDIRGAIAALRRLVEASGDPDDRMLLGQLVFLTTDYAEATNQLERAYRDFQSLGMPRQAAMAATHLGRVYFDGLENQVVGRGWFTRALGLLEHEEPCVERGYAALGLVGCSVASADELDASARMALDLAHRFQDRALECKALADWGLALVSMGRLREGMARLDQAFTMIVGGECTNQMVIAMTVCCMLSACDRCGDVTRAESWLSVIEKNAPPQRDGPAGGTFAHCWSAFGSVLCQVGRWQEAETTLRMGLAKGETHVQHTRLETRAALAGLWIRQGRLEEAARLIDENVDRVEIMGPRARLYLAQGRFDLAAAVARQALRQLSGDRLRAAPLLLTLVDSELGRGNIEAAQQAALQLAQLSEDTEVASLPAQAALALGKVAASRRELQTAAKHFDAGLAALVGGDWPLVRAALHLELARVQAANAPAAATVEAQAALSIYQRIGAPEATVAAGVLKALGVAVKVAPPPLTPLRVLSKREREVLGLVAQGMSNPGIAKQLFITPKTAEHHVTNILGKLGLRNRAEAAAFSASLQISPDASA
jgi:DNA-binding NarL/FixJ family response regulator